MHAQRKDAGSADSQAIGATEDAAMSLHSAAARHSRSFRFHLYAALMSMILNLSVPRGAETSTTSPFFLPMIALPTGDSFESLFSAGFASAEPTMKYSTVWFASMSFSFTLEPIDTTSDETSS